MKLLQISNNVLLISFKVSRKTTSKYNICELKMRILLNRVSTFFVYATKAEAVDDSLKQKR